MSQKQLATAAGCSQGFISQLESGEIKDPGALTLDRIIHALGGSIPQLLEAPSPRRTRNKVG